MRIKELSIGDWVMIEGAPTKVWYLSEDGEVNDTTYDIEPIPITPEIVEKNGFVDYEVGKGWYVLNVADDLRVWLHRNSHDWTFQLMKWSPLYTHEIGKVFIKHTHQLQHALRLAGVGKEIEV